MFTKRKSAHTTSAEPCLRIGMANDFSKVVFLHTDEKGNLTETIILRDGSVKVNSQAAEDLYMARNEFFPGTMIAQEIIQSADKILAEQGMRVKRFLFTQPHLQKEEQSLGL